MCCHNYNFFIFKQLERDVLVSKEDLLKALQNNFEGYEVVRAMLLNRAPKYGNDVEWVDELGAKWALKFRNKLRKFYSQKM